MKSRPLRLFALSFLPLPLLIVSAFANSANTVQLGSASGYAVLAGSAVTNTGATTLNGNLGVSPGCAISGAGTMTVNGTTNACNGPALKAQTDLTKAYIAAQSLSPTKVLTGTDLGGLTLTPGVYFFATSAQLTGTLTLNNLGNPDAQFVFQIGSTLTTASNSSVIFTSSLSDPNVFWQVGSSATLGTSTAFEGNILALSSITLNTSASITCGSALAQTGAVTLQGNTISSCGSGGTSTVPEPGTLGLLGTGLAILAGVARRKLRI